MIREQKVLSPAGAAPVPIPPASIPVWALPIGLAATPILLTFLAYLPSLGNGFVNWDDPQNILNNLHISSLSPANLRWMFTSLDGNYWMPLSWLSLALDYSVAGPTAWFFHLDSLILHLLNTLLVFLIGLELFKPAEHGITGASPFPFIAAFLSALIFGLHPLHVESVAWASERKDVLCGFLFLLGIFFYLKAAGRVGWKNWRLWACLAAFSMALMAKPMAVTFPAVLVLLDAWPLKRFKTSPHRALLEKTPFLALSLLASIVTLAAPASYSTVENVPFFLRLMNAFHSATFYLLKMLLPFGLHAYYPLDPAVQALSPLNEFSGAFVVLLTLACLFVRRRQPFFTVAWLYYLVTLFPVLGLARIGDHASADRYTYLPSLGPCFLAAAYLTFFLRSKGALLAVGAALALFLGFLTLRQAGLWRTSISLWMDASSAFPNQSYLPHLKLAEAYRDSGNKGGAAGEFRRAALIRPDLPFLHDDAGAALSDAGRLDEAAVEFKTALGLDPRDALAHYNLSVVYARQGREGRAEEELRRTLELDSRFTLAYRGLGYLYLAQGDGGRALEAFQAAAGLDPGNPEYFRGQGRAYLIQGKRNNARAAFQAADQRATAVPATN